MHKRFSPKKHQFLYHIFLLGLDLDELEPLSRKIPFFSLNRRNLYSFRESDFMPVNEPLHNDHDFASAHSNVQEATELRPSKSLPGASGNLSPASGLKDRVLGYLTSNGIDLTGGKVFLITLPRILGYLFNPVSFYFCFDRVGRPVASIAEVTNTFREMKLYLLGPETLDLSRKSSVSLDEPPLASETQPPMSRTPQGSGIGDIFRLRIPKDFYVSPFSDVDLEFDFKLRLPDNRLSVQIDDYDHKTRTLTSSLTGIRRPLTSVRLAWLTLKYPLLTLKIIGLIHWNALLLYWKKMPWFQKSAKGSGQRKLYRPHSSLSGNRK